MSHTPHESGTDDRNLELLVKKLRQAAEIEQQFMCMYLYGAFSIQKRYVDGQPLDPTRAQLEITRRWASMVYLVARQEMEHLALVNNLLASVGAAPYFARTNLDKHPLREYHLGASPSPVAQSGAVAKRCDDLDPIPHDFQLTPFDLAAARRWTCMESPSCEVLAEGDGDHFAEWCFRPKAKATARGVVEPVGPGTIEELYDELAVLFKTIPDSAFVTSAAQQVVIEQQYDIYVFPVTDHASAVQAMNLVTEQGEGISASPTYPSHYRRFFDIVKEWQKHEPLSAFWNLKPNPVSSDIHVDYTRRLFDLFNEAYATLLIMLTGLYATRKQLPDKYPYFAPALGMEAFAPFMTMVIRSLAEVLVQLRATDVTRGERAERVGPGFYISDSLNDDLRQPYEDRCDGMAGSQLKPIFGDIDGITDRVEQFSSKLQNLIDSGGKPPVIDDTLSDWAVDRLQYIQANSARIAVNLRRIYQQGVFPALQTDGF